MKFDLSKIQKLARAATHPSANPNEAVVAGWKACLQILESDSTHEIIWLNASNLKANPQDASLEAEIKHLRRQVQDLIRSADQLKLREKTLIEEHEQAKVIFIKRIGLLTQDRNRWQQESERLQDLNEDLSNQNSHLETVSQSDDGALYVSYERLVSKAEQISGHNCSKSSIAFALDIGLSTLSAWQKVGIVPMGFVNKLGELSEDRFGPASRAPWSEDEVNKLKEFVSERTSDLDAARTLSKQFGRRRFELSVARKRRQLAEQGWKPSPKDRSSSVWSKDDIAYPDVPDQDTNQTQFPHHRAKPRPDTPGKAVP